MITGPLPIFLQFLGVRKIAYTYRALVTYTNHACLFHLNKGRQLLGDSLLAKGVSCPISVVKADSVQGGSATNCVRREVSILWLPTGLLMCERKWRRPGQRGLKATLVIVVRTR